MRMMQAVQKTFLNGTNAQNLKPDTARQNECKGARDKKYVHTININYSLLIAMWKGTVRRSTLCANASAPLAYAKSCGQYGSPRTVL